MTPHPYVAIEGVIGVGKTTLARLLQPILDGDLLLEVFEENPFLASFYTDRERYAFQTQIFFLLSRYHQQKAITPHKLEQQPLASDYTFAKDRLFAGLNLRGDELEMYHRVHDALAEKIAKPNLLIYLRADTDVLMSRIIARDRPYERNMERDYIAQLGAAYEQFATNWTESPLLIIDTNDLNIVSNPDDLNLVIERVMSALELGVYQQRLPGVEPFNVDGSGGAT
jgi:deoxyadenosine/deoxycytidine kinase